MLSHLDASSRLGSCQNQPPPQNESSCVIERSCINQKVFIKEVEWIREVKLTPMGIPLIVSTTSTVAISVAVENRTIVSHSFTTDSPISSISEVLGFELPIHVPAPAKNCSHPQGNLAISIVRNGDVLFRRLFSYDVLPNIATLDEDDRAMLVLQSPDKALQLRLLCAVARDEVGQLIDSRVVLSDITLRAGVGGLLDRNDFVRACIPLGA
jgi:hypothetical protein